MAIVIKWTNEAVLTFEKNIYYLLDKWSEKEVKLFVTNSNRIIQQITKHPQRYPVSQKSVNIHKAPINKYIRLYYRYSEQKGEITLLTFWNTKQNPSKLVY